MAHNHYRQRGGEDESTAVEMSLLRKYGDEVIELIEDNTRIQAMSGARAAARTIWSAETYRRARNLIRETRPDIVHVQNFFPLLSPSLHYAAARERRPVVQTLRNYRLICPSGLLFRDGVPCMKCTSRRIALPAVRHRCYRDDLLASATVTAMLGVHRLLATWSRKVSLFVTLSEFARNLFVDAGFPDERIVTKPNCVHPDPGVGDGGGRYALFVGRLSGEKGIATLLDAWEVIGERLPLKIVGDGPLSSVVRDAAVRIPGLEYLGRRTLADVHTLMGRAVVVVVPSECFETFGRVGAEAFASATPVIASNIGALAELVDHGRTGLLFEPGSAASLCDAVDQLLSRPVSETCMRQEARREYETRYSADSNHAALREVYERATALELAR